MVNLGLEDMTMEKKSMAVAGDRRDTFIVRSSPKAPEFEIRPPSTKTFVLPGGQKVHAIDRDIFESALRKARKK